MTLNTQASDEFDQEEIIETAVPKVAADGKLPAASSDAGHRQTTGSILRKKRRYFSGSAADVVAAAAAAASNPNFQNDRHKNGRSVTMVCTEDLPRYGSDRSYLLGEIEVQAQTSLYLNELLLNDDCTTPEQQSEESTPGGEAVEKNSSAETPAGNEENMNANQNPAIASFKELEASPVSSAPQQLAATPSDDEGTAKGSGTNDTADQVNAGPDASEDVTKEEQPVSEDPVSTKRTPAKLRHQASSSSSCCTTPEISIPPFLILYLLWKPAVSNNGNLSASFINHVLKEVREIEKLVELTAEDDTTTQQPALSRRHSGCKPKASLYVVVDCVLPPDVSKQKNGRSSSSFKKKRSAEKSEENKQSDALSDEVTGDTHKDPTSIALAASSTSFASAESTEEPDGHVPFSREATSALLQQVSKEPHLRRVLHGVTFGVSDHPRAAPGLDAISNVLAKIGAADRRQYSKEHSPSKQTEQVAARPPPPPSARRSLVHSNDITHPINDAPSIESLSDDNDALLNGSRGFKRRRLGDNNKSCIALIVDHPNTLLGLAPPSPGRGSDQKKNGESPQDQEEYYSPTNVTQWRTVAEWHGRGNLNTFCRRAHMTWRQILGLPQQPQVYEKRKIPKRIVRPGLAAAAAGVASAPGGAAAAALNNATAMSLMMRMRLQQYQKQKSNSKGNNASSLTTVTTANTTAIVEQRNSHNDGLDGDSSWIGLLLGGPRAIIKHVYWQYLMDGSVQEWCHDGLVTMLLIAYILFHFRPDLLLLVQQYVAGLNALVGEIGGVEEMVQRLREL